MNQFGFEMVFTQPLRERVHGFAVGLEPRFHRPWPISFDFSFALFCKTSNRAGKMALPPQIRRGGEAPVRTLLRITFTQSINTGVKTRLLPSG